MLRILAAFLVLTAFPALARDDGRYANSPLKPWFDGLKNEHGTLCCSFADGKTVQDVDWRSSGDHYEVFLDGHWLEVLPTSVIQEPNRFGPAVVWPLYADGKATGVLCFIPGAGA